MMKGLMTIELKGLRFFADHGLYADEARTGNEFEINVSLEYPAPDQTISSIHQTIDYAVVYEIIREEFSIRQELLETCAMKISSELHKSFPGITRVQISIDKLTPLITNFIGSLGVTYTCTYK